LRLAEELAAFPPTSVTARVIGALSAAVPGAPGLPPYASVEEAAGAVLGGVPDDVLARAKELLAAPRVDQALFAAKTIDTGDTGLTIVSGVRSAMALFLGKGDRSAAMAQQQRTDAAVKAFGLAYLLTRLLPVPPAERIELVRSVPAGLQLLLYFGAIEVAVPFAAEVEAAGGSFVANLIQSQGRALADKVLAVVGREGAADAQEMLGDVVAELDRAALAAVPHTAALAERIKGLLPAVASSLDVFDLVAAGVDALPAYRYLVARLAVEASLALAKHEKMPDVPLPKLTLPGEAAAPPPPPPVPVGLTTVVPGEQPAVEAEVAAPPVVEEVVPATVPDEADDAPPPPSEPPAPGWPTTPLPEAQRLRGCWLIDGDPPRWQIYTVEGVFTDGPPEAPGPVDWDAHAARGHTVALYRRDGGDVVFGGRRIPVARDDRSLTVGGERYARTDWDLTGRSLDGRWDGPEALVLAGDGLAQLGARRGRYELGVGRITFRWSDGTEEPRTLLSDLQPSSRAPAVLWLGGVRYRRSEV
jgi:hypothetical protein